MVTATYPINFIVEVLSATGAFIIANTTAASIACCTVVFDEEYTVVIVSKVNIPTGKSAMQFSA